MKRKTCILKNIVMLFMAIGLVTAFISCTNKDNDEIGPLRQEVQSLRANLTKEFDAKVNAKAEEFKAQLDKAKADIAALGQRSQGLSLEEVQAEINKATADLVNTAAAQAMYDKYVESVRAQLEGAVTEAQLNALKQDIEGKVADNSKALGDLSSEVNGKIVTINQKIASLETMVGDSKGAFQQGLDNLKSEITAELDKLKAENPKLRNEISEVERKASEALTMKVNELNEKIEAQKTELVKMLGEYKKANEELIKANGELIKTNKDDIQGLKDRVQTLESGLTTANDKFTKFVEETLPNLFSTILNSRLTSLVLLPDYVADNGGALPVISFSPLKTACGKLSPAVMVKYVVNPSTVTASDIDTQNLKFRYNDPMVASKTRSEMVAPKAKFVSLENGILTVEASINVDGTWAAASSNPKNRIDQLMLEVPVAGEDAVVSSDWAKIDYKTKSAVLVKTPKQVSSDSWSKYELVSTVQKAKDLVVTAPTVVEMAWDATVDMNDVVKSMYTNWQDFNPSMYDLEFAYDLKDENGSNIVYNIGGNDTNQQEFINLNGSEVSTRVYGKDANRAAIGRTPIVHVMLKKKGGDCIAKQGFVKFSIVEKAIPPVPPITFEPDGETYDATCGTPQIVHRIGTKEMNEEFYHAVDMSKEDFHKNYKFKNLDGGVGTIEEIKDPNDDTSYNLVYKLTEDEVWKNAGKTVWKKATYTYGTSVIEMKFKVAIVKPTVTLDVLLDNYWYNNSALVKSGENGVKNTIVQNVAVPKSADDSNSNNATYDNNINNAFESVNHLLNTGGYDYEYMFDEGSQPLEGASVSVDGKQLIYGGQVVATIERTADGDMIKYGTSDKAKELLNKGPEYSKAKVVLVVKNSCGKALNVVVKGLEGKDRFNVIFLRPINVAPKSGKHFVDGVDFGTAGSYIDIKKIAQLSDWRNYITGTEKYNFLPDHENYYGYYGVKNIKVNIAGIKTEGLTVGGRAISNVPETVEIKQTENDETVGGKTYKYGRLTYRNNGNNLGQEFWLVLPVTVEYKWGEIVNTTVKVKVASTKNARKIVK